MDIAAAGVVFLEERLVPPAAPPTIAPITIKAATAMVMNTLLFVWKIHERFGSVAGIGLGLSTGSPISTGAGCELAEYSVSSRSTNRSGSG